MFFNLWFRLIIQFFCDLIQHWLWVGEVKAMRCFCKNELWVLLMNDKDGIRKVLKYSFLQLFHDNEPI